MRKKKKVNANETYMQTVMRRFRAHHLAKISLVILVVVGLAALFAPVVAPCSPDYTCRSGASGTVDRTV